MKEKNVIDGKGLPDDGDGDYEGDGFAIAMMVVKKMTM
jgi:hypothetical protein